MQCITWESLLRVFFIQNAVHGSNSAKILVIDEFPCLVQLDPALPGIVQKLCDTGAISGLNRISGVKLS
ncbi:MAG: hypothetical protein GF350_13340 [Chitinivibrionales bacterium]|nr:hypothetical protein [Chitinivibrionales bacterium]